MLLSDKPLYGLPVDDWGRVAVTGTDEPPQRYWSTSDVARLSGASLRQLQWWDETRMVKVTHSGNQRQYFEADVIQIMVIATLRKRGLTMPRIWRAMPRLRHLKREDGLKGYLLVSTKGHVKLIRKRLCDDKDELIECLANAEQPYYVISLAGIAEKIYALDGLRRIA